MPVSGQIGTVLMLTGGWCEERLSWSVVVLV